jgi:hypothetical protein
MHKLIAVPSFIGRQSRAKALSPAGSKFVGVPVSHHRTENPKHRKKGRTEFLRFS